MPEVIQMGAGSWLSDIGNAGRLLIERIPEVSWLVYTWAKDWQGLLGGLLLLLAAWIFARGILHAARIRAAALVGSAEIAAGAQPQAASANPAVGRDPPHPVSPENALVQRVEQLRSLIRSAMSTLTSDGGTLSSAPNFYCERIALLRLEDAKLPASLTSAAGEHHKKLLQQLAVVRQAMEKQVPQSELSHALVQLNARARELSAALSSP